MKDDDISFNPFERALRRLKADSRLWNREATYADAANKALFDYYDPCDLIKGENVPERVCIIGGGVSGLTAAFEFDRLAKKYKRPSQILLLEKSKRFGGRILTHRFDEQNYVELGPMRLPSYHQLALHYVKDVFNLDVHQFSGEADYWLSGSAEGRLDELAAAEHVLAGYFGRSQRFPRAFFRTGSDQPGFSVGAFVKKFVTAMRDFPDYGFRNLPYSEYGLVTPSGGERHWELFFDRPRTVWGRVAEGLSIRQGVELFVRHYLDNLYKSDPRNFYDIMTLSPEEFGALAEKVWEDVGRVTGLIWLEHVSLFHFLREETALNADHKFAIDGGFQRLADAFVESLKQSRHVTLERRATVEHVELREETVHVHWRNPAGGSSIQEFDCVICAVPAPAALRIDFTPELPISQRRAFAGISYLAAAKSGAYFSHRFWESDGKRPKLGGVTYTDLPNQQIWYPNERLIVDEDVDNVIGKLEPGFEDRDAYEGEAQFVAEPNRIKQVEGGGGRGALLSAYMWGDNARRLAAMSRGEQDRLMRDCLEKVYPGCTKYLIDMKHWCWDRQLNPGGGAFAWYAPQQHSRYQKAAAIPHRAKPNGRNLVCFAGEHLGLIQGWVQGAMQTALGALLQACTRQKGI